MGTAGYGTEHWSMGQSYGQAPVYSPAIYKCVPSPTRPTDSLITMLAPMRPRAPGSRAQVSPTASKSVCITPPRSSLPMARSSSPAPTRMRTSLPPSGQRAIRWRSGTLSGTVIRVRNLVASLGHSPTSVYCYKHVSRSQSNLRAGQRGTSRTPRRTRPLTRKTRRSSSSGLGFPLTA